MLERGLDVCDLCDSSEFGDFSNFREFCDCCDLFNDFGDLGFVILAMLFENCKYFVEQDGFSLKMTDLWVETETFQRKIGKSWKMEDSGEWKIVENGKYGNGK